MRLVAAITFAFLPISFSVINVFLPLISQGAEVATPSGEKGNPDLPNKVTFPILISSHVIIGSLEMYSTGMIGADGQVTGSTVTKITVPVGAPCGGVFVVPRALDGSELGVYRMVANSPTSMPFCVHGVMTSRNDPQIRTDSWMGEIPKAIISQTASAVLRQGCVSNCP